MAPKPIEKMKTRRTSNKCDVCGHSFINLAALKSHYKFNHATKGVGVKKTLFKPHILKKTLKRKIVLPKEDDRVASPVNTDVPKKEEPVLPPKTAQLRRIEFECPVCSKVFPVYFSAHRHIQKYHCVDNEGAEVDSRSPDLIKPIRIELCVSCRERISSSEDHKCDDPKLLYKCFSCSEGAETLAAFERHVKDSHADDAQFLFFASTHACSSWRKQMESQTGTFYVPLKKTKQLKSFRCSHQKTTDNGKIVLCPSLIVIEEAPTGFDIYHYKKHHGHQTKMIDDTSKEDRLKEFQTTLNEILNNSKEVNDVTLKVLMNKAMQMVLVLKKYQQEQKLDKSIDDEEISLELNTTNKTKRTYSEMKSAKSESKEPNSLEKKELSTIGSKRRVTRNSDSNFEEKKDLSTAQIEKELTLPDKDLKKELELRTVMQSPPSFNDSYKNFVDKTFMKGIDPKITNSKKSKKKSIMKTKIGQFKPSLSPKTKENSPVSSPVSKPSTPTPQITKDVKYEVKEQENDCNILILKF